MATDKLDEFNELMASAGPPWATSAEDMLLVALQAALAGQLFMAEHKRDLDERAARELLRIVGKEIRRSGEERALLQPLVEIVNGKVGIVLPALEERLALEGVS